MPPWHGEKDRTIIASHTLVDFVEITATKVRIPGVAVGVWADGCEIYACHGITSLRNPLPVDQDTLYVLGSMTKTYTATALIRLVLKVVSRWTHRCDRMFEVRHDQRRLLQRQDEHTFRALKLETPTFFLGWPEGKRIPEDAVNTVTGSCTASRMARSVGCKSPGKAMTRCPSGSIDLQSAELPHDLVARRVRKDPARQRRNGPLRASCRRSTRL